MQGARGGCVLQGHLSSRAAISCVVSMLVSLLTQERVTGMLVTELSLHMPDVCGVCGDPPGVSSEGRELPPPAEHSGGIHAGPVATQPLSEDAEGGRGAS